APGRRRWLLAPRGSELQRGRGGERGGERQRGGERDRAALPEDETQRGRRDATGGDDEQGATAGHRGATSASTRRTDAIARRRSSSSIWWSLNRAISKRPVSSDAAGALAPSIRRTRAVNSVGVSSGARESSISPSDSSMRA